MHKSLSSHLFNLKFKSLSGEMVRCIILTSLHPSAGFVLKVECGRAKLERGCAQYQKDAETNFVRTTDNTNTANTKSFRTSIIIAHRFADIDKQHAK